MRQGRLAGRYPAAAAMVVFALIPYLALSAALQPLTPIITRDLHMSLQTLSLGTGLANAGYALGTVLAVALAQHLPQRRLLVGYAALLVLGSVLTATAQNPAMFIGGHVLQGLCTSLMLIAAVPPLALGFGTARFRETAVIMNLCIFGAVALGPTVGGIQAQADAWRPLFFVVAGVSLTALVLTVLTFEDAPPANRSAPFDPLAIALAGAGSVAAFFGASELLTHAFLSPITFVPLVGGLALIVVLIVYQFRAKRPLLTIRSMLTSTMPVAGIVVALFAAAASVSATALTAALLAGHYGPLHIGLLYLPELAGAILTAFALGIVITRREMHYLPLAGMVFLAAGIATFLIQTPPSQTLTLIGSALTGIGLGASVAPALFVAGFSLAGRESPTRVRDHRAPARRRGVHDRAGVRALRRHRRRQRAVGDGDRALDRAWTRHRRRRHRGRALRAGRSAPAGAGPRPLHARRAGRVVLATAPGRGAQARPTPSPRRGAL